LDAGNVISQACYKRRGTEPIDIREGQLFYFMKKRGFLLSGGELDTERMAAVLLDEFRGGKLGRITLEPPPEEG
jgi:ribosome biogenesis GTPase A